MEVSQMNFQLKEAGQFTGAAWAIWLERSGEWEPICFYKISLKQRSIVLNLVKNPAMERWLEGILKGKTNISRKIPKNSGLSGGKLYVFPNRLTQRVILVGMDNLSETAQRFWRAVSSGNSGEKSINPEIASIPLNFDWGQKYIPRSMQGILGLVIKACPSQGVWLAIRAGGFLEIQEGSILPDWKGKRFSILPNPLLRGICQTRKARMVLKNDKEWEETSQLGVTNTTRFWAGLPLISGKRLSGIIALWGITPPSDEDWKKLVSLTHRIAPSVERCILLKDLTHQFHRMRLLDDFAATIHSSLDMEQIVQRTLALLRNSFITKRVFLMTLFPAESGNKCYFEHEGSVSSEDKPVEILPAQVIKGETFRPETISAVPSYLPIYAGSQSVIITPLKLRKRVIGALGLENEREGAFTIQDEHLLVVIASHIAGLLENGWLRQEAEARVRNLSQIREILHQVIGQTDVRHLAQSAAELISHNFDGELVVVSLERGPNRELQVAGISGMEANLVQKETKYLNAAMGKGIEMRVATNGKSVLVNDVTKDPAFVRLPNWEAGSEMCVALKDGDESFGIVDVESKWKNAFSQTDLQVLESMAGILASAISNVGQHQKLQVIEKQLQATHAELQEHVAAQRMAERRLVQAAKLAAVGEMAAGIAHELNNPLTTVSGFTELTLEEVPPDSRLHADLELVLREAHRATDVVRRLLDFARQSESTRTRSDINEIVKEVLALINHLIWTSGVHLEEDLPNNLPLVSVDRNQAKQVILNLIHNALHAMPNGGKLYISSARRSRDHQDWVIVTVKDTGIGISPENLEKIFVPFFTTRAKEGGTGLGLSISYGLIAEHGGFIEAESQVGKGSIFSIWIPVEVN
jgi:signal transduction histidine kinase